MRAFTIPELRDWLLAAGFARVDAYDEEGRRFGPGAAKAVVVASC